jgi:lysylphosphatidylglycerol synthetase-like protein (DUF2156 family)
MKKLALVLLLALTGTLAFAADPVPYDPAVVKDIMHINQATIGAVTKAIAAADWVAVADGFIQYTVNAKKALTFAAPKGDSKEWTRLWTDFLFAAYQGVGAAGAKDPVAAKKFLDQITGDRNAGHPQFKP